MTPSSGWYAAGAQVAITATASAGNQFLGFSGTMNSSGSPLTVTMNGPVTETAQFGLVASFGMTVTATSPTTVAAGGSATYAVSVTALNGFSGAVRFSATVQPAGPTVAFNPAQVTGTGTSTMTVSTPAGTATGIYQVTVTAAGGVGPTCYATLTVIPPPVITAVSSTTVAPGDSITITGSNLGSLTTTSAIISGATAAPSSVSAGQVVVTVPANAAVSDNATLYVTVNGIASSTVAIRVVPPFTFTKPRVVPGYVSTSYCLSLQTGDCQRPDTLHPNATGGTAPYTFSASTGSGSAPYNTLPEGLSLSSSGLFASSKVPGSGSLDGVLFPELAGYPFSATRTYAGTYSFTVTVTDSAGRSASWVLSLTVNPLAILPSLATFQDCIGANGAALGYGMTCELQAGTYNVGPGYQEGSTTTVPFTDSYGRPQHQLVIGRSGTPAQNLVITGTPIGGLAADTVLRRGDPTFYTAAWDSAIMTAAAATGCAFCPPSVSSLPITNVTIEYLTFDGNRYDSYGTSGRPLQCWLTQEEYFDLYLGPGILTNVEGIFTVQWDDFINSPDTAIMLGGTGSTSPPIASTISFCSFGQGGSGIGPSGAETPTDGHPEYTATRFTAVYMLGSYTGAYYNAISYAGTAGVTLDQDNLYHQPGTNQVVYGNLLDKNRYELSDGSGGGQLALYQTTVNATVAANVINGENWPDNSVVCATKRSNGGCVYTFSTGCSVVDPAPPGFAGPQTFGGIEASGTGHRFYNNEITNHTGGGMAIGMVFPTGQIMVSGRNPWDASDSQRYIENNASDGIVVYGGYQGYPSALTAWKVCFYSRTCDGRPGGRTSS